MCTVSMIGDGWEQQFPNRWPQVIPNLPSIPEVSRTEFDALKKEMQELKKLLMAAKKFDEATGQPDCEIDDKVKLIKEIAKLVGVDMAGVFDSKRKRK